MKRRAFLKSCAAAIVAWRWPRAARAAGARGPIRPRPYPGRVMLLDPRRWRLPGRWAG